MGGVGHGGGERKGDGRSIRVTAEEGGGSGSGGSCSSRHPRERRGQPHNLTDPAFPSPPLHPNPPPPPSCFRDLLHPPRHTTPPPHPIIEAQARHTTPPNHFQPHHNIDPQLFHITTHYTTHHSTSHHPTRTYHETNTQASHMAAFITTQPQIIVSKTCTNLTDCHYQDKHLTLLLHLSSYTIKGGEKLSAKLEVTDSSKPYQVGDHLWRILSLVQSLK